MDDDHANQLCLLLNLGAVRNTYAGNRISHQSDRQRHPRGDLSRVGDADVPGDLVPGVLREPDDARGASGEIVGNNYSRTAIASNATNWSANATGQMVNALQINLPVPSANWTPIYGWGLFDASSGGNMWYGGILPGLLFATTSTPFVAAGALILQL